MALDLLEDLCPQGQASPETGVFSLGARSQVHWPAGRAPDVMVLVSEEKIRTVGGAADHTARAARPRDGVLGRGLVAGAVEGVLLAAGALGLSGADAATVTGGLAAGGSRVDHFDCWWWELRVEKTKDGFPSEGGRESEDGPMTSRVGVGWVDLRFDTRRRDRSVPRRSDR